MNRYFFTVFFGLAFALTGCSTTGKMSHSQESSPNGLSPLFQAFSSLGDVAQMDNGIKLTLDGDSLFKAGYSHLGKDGIQKIDVFAAALMKFPGAHAAIMTYTDNRGMATRNLSLSNRRAENIKRELVKRGIPSDNVTTLGKGDANPVAPNDTPVNQAKNRRVEIQISAL